MIVQERMTVASQRPIARGVFEIRLAGRLAEEVTAPGQFVHIRVADSYEPLLRRPLSIASVEGGELTILYRADGRGTSLLAQKRRGESVDVFGPLGNGFPVEAAQAGETALLVGGGIGVPPLYGLSKALFARGVRCLHALGFPSAADAFYIEPFQELGETRIATADGTLGTEGVVTDVIAQFDAPLSVYYSCGPTPMLRAVQEQLAALPGFLSLEQRMGCGIGACFACACPTAGGAGKGYVKICSDGPVFAAGEVAL